MFLLNVPFFDKWNFISISENIDLGKPKTGCCHLLPFGQTFLHYCVIFTKISCLNQRKNGKKNASNVMILVLNQRYLPLDFKIYP